LIRLADLLLPNSKAEARQLRQLFGARPDRIVIVPNGVDDRFGRGDARSFESKYGVTDFVLVPGRIEPRKNQLGVVTALWSSGLPVVVLGDTHPEHRDYDRKCRLMADPGVHFVKHIAHGSELLAAAYAASRVVVLASWFETPGLAALEGALAGAHVIVTHRGSAFEYFGDFARYVSPTDLAGIRLAVRQAYQSPPPRELKQQVARNFLWDSVAHHTLLAYQTMLPAKAGRLQFPARLAAAA
jgi:glycosyltransferase involved in cell wall biosynthesis